METSHFEHLVDGEEENSAISPAMMLHRIFADWSESESPAAPSTLAHIMWLASIILDKSHDFRDIQTANSIIHVLDLIVAVAHDVAGSLREHCDGTEPNDVNREESLLDSDNV